MATLVNYTCKSFIKLTPAPILICVYNTNSQSSGIKQVNLIYFAHWNRTKWRTASAVTRIIILEFSQVAVKI